MSIAAGDDKTLTRLVFLACGRAGTAVALCLVDALTGAREQPAYPWGCAEERVARMSFENPLDANIALRRGGCGCGHHATQTEHDAAIARELVANDFAVEIGFVFVATNAPSVL